MHKSFEGRCNLIYSDTDSLLNNIQHENIYHWFKETSYMLTFPIQSETTWETTTINRLLASSKKKQTVLPKTEFAAFESKRFFFQPSQKKNDTINNTKKSKGVLKINSEARDKTWPLYAYNEYAWAVEQGCRLFKVAGSYNKNDQESSNCSEHCLWQYAMDTCNRLCAIWI